MLIYYSKNNKITKEIFWKTSHSSPPLGVGHSGSKGKLIQKEPK